MTGAGLHLLDALVHLAGPIARVDARLFAQKPPPDPRDAVAVLVGFENGATGLIGTVRAAPVFWRVHAFGTRGWAEARDETTLMRRADRRGCRMTQRLKHVDSLGVLLEAFAAAIETGAPFPVTTRARCST